MNESFNHAGAWGIALIFIVLVSWFFYRYFAPKNWREWAGAGVVQAFIIALYAEMYGFPLTIYLLVRFFGLDSEYVSASLWSTLVGLGETGMLVSMLLGTGLAPLMQWLVLPALVLGLARYHLFGAGYLAARTGRESTVRSTSSARVR